MPRDCITVCASTGVAIRSGARHGGEAGAIGGHAPEEAGSGADMAGPAVALRPDLQEDRVLVAVDAHLFHDLDLARGLGNG
jgi:hypothetical protein